MVFSTHCCDFETSSDGTCDTSVNESCGSSFHEDDLKTKLLPCRRFQSQPVEKQRGHNSNITMVAPSPPSTNRSWCMKISLRCLQQTLPCIAAICEFVTTLLLLCLNSVVASCLACYISCHRHGESCCVKLYEHGEACCLKLYEQGEACCLKLHGCGEWCCKALYGCGKVCCKSLYGCGKLCCKSLYGCGKLCCNALFGCVLLCDACFSYLEICFESCTAACFSCMHLFGQDEDARIIQHRALVGGRCWSCALKIQSILRRVSGLSPDESGEDWHFRRHIQEHRLVPPVTFQTGDSNTNADVVAHPRDVALGNADINLALIGTDEDRMGFMMEDGAYGA